MTSGSHTGRSLHQRSVEGDAPDARDARDLELLLRRQWRKWTIASAVPLCASSVGALVGIWLLVTDARLGSGDAAALSALSGLLAGVIVSLSRLRTIPPLARVRAIRSPSRLRAIAPPGAVVDSLFPELFVLSRLVEVLFGAITGFVAYALLESDWFVTWSATRPNPPALFGVGFLAGLVAAATRRPLIGTRSRGG